MRVTKKRESMLVIESECKRVSSESHLRDFVSDLSLAALLLQP